MWNGRKQQNAKCMQRLTFLCVGNISRSMKGTMQSLLEQANTLS